MLPQELRDLILDLTYDPLTQYLNNHGKYKQHLAYYDKKLSPKVWKSVLSSDWDGDLIASSMPSWFPYASTSVSLLKSRTMYDRICQFVSHNYSNPIIQRKNHNAVTNPYAQSTYEFPYFAYWTCCYWLIYIAMKKSWITDTEIKWRNRDLESHMLNGFQVSFRDGLQTRSVSLDSWEADKVMEQTIAESTFHQKLDILSGCQRQKQLILDKANHVPTSRRSVKMFLASYCPQRFEKWDALKCTVWFRHQDIFEFLWTQYQESEGVKNIVIEFESTSGLGRLAVEQKCEFAWKRMISDMPECEMSALIEVAAKNAWLEVIEYIPPKFYLARKHARKTRTARKKLTSRYMDEI
jgi:hypothetical protein